MNRVLGFFLFIIFQITCNGQATYIEFHDVSPRYNMSEYMEEQVPVICPDCPDGKGPPLTTAENKRNQAAAAWRSRIEKILKENCRYDSARNYYNVTDSFLALIRSEYYIWFLKSANKVLFIGPNQNSSSPEYKFNSHDSIAGTIRYRVVCKDCQYPKRKTLYYIFYYDNKGLILRHGLAALNQKYKRK